MRGAKNNKSKLHLPKTEKKRQERTHTYKMGEMKIAGFRKGLSLKQNMKILGLSLDPNEDFRKPGQNSTEAQRDASLIEKYRKENIGDRWTQEYDSLTEIKGSGANAARKKSLGRFLNDERIRYISRLYEKHGEDIDKMFWDLELNPNQKTKGFLQREIYSYKQHLAFQAELDAKKSSSS